jgi:hypothetical protein
MKNQNKWQIKFYASKKNVYYNKMFCFNCLDEEQCLYWLWFFRCHGNLFNQIFIQNLSTKDNLKIDQNTLILFNLNESFIEAAIANLH